MLDNIHRCDNESVRIKYTAVARFFRAYFYFLKVRDFGDVPWYDHELSVTEKDELYKARDSRDFVMTKMIEDIDYAIRYLPDEANAYRVTKWTALAFKSRFCLFEGTWRKYHGNGNMAHDADYYLKQAEDAALQKLNDMSDEEALEASLKRISTETERLTRRNMKECVAAHIQELCRKDTEFARKTMHPHKSMVNCFKYITRMAKEYVKQEMEDMGIQQDGGGYGCDVPDGLCYQWGEDYFNAADAQEDKEKEETFIPKPYTGTTTKTAAKKSNKAEKKQQDKPSNGYEQISLEGMM